VPDEALTRLDKSLTEVGVSAVRAFITCETETRPVLTISPLDNELMPEPSSPPAS
jgi:hypothetical protein